MAPTNPLVGGAFQHWQCKRVLAGESISNIPALTPPLSSQAEHPDPPISVANSLPLAGASSASPAPTAAANHAAVKHASPIEGPSIKIQFRGDSPEARLGRLYAASISS